MVGNQESRSLPPFGVGTPYQSKRAQEILLIVVICKGLVEFQQENDSSRAAGFRVRWIQGPLNSGAAKFRGRWIQGPLN